jgi:prenylcysteine oxidase/farnesylcysteine lyase
VEVGGSIFIEANKNMWRASDEFNLTRLKFDEEDGDVGIWDGDKFVFIVSSFRSLRVEAHISQMQEGGRLTQWWQTAKVLWRYGWSAPYRSNNIANKLKGDIGELYRPDAPRWQSVEDLSTHLGWKALTARTASEHFQVNGVSRQFTHEMIEAATRVNYGQNADDIHALGGAVSLAAENASGVKGGNFLIFENFVNASGARVALKTEASLLYIATCILIDWSTGQVHHSEGWRRSLDGRDGCWRLDRLHRGHPCCTIPPNRNLSFLSRADRNHAA